MWYKMAVFVLGTVSGAQRLLYAAGEPGSAPGLAAAPMSLSWQAVSPHRREGSYHTADRQAQMTGRACVARVER